MMSVILIGKPVSHDIFSMKTPSDSMTSLQEMRDSESSPESRREHRRRSRHRHRVKKFRYRLLFIAIQAVLILLAIYFWTTIAE